MIHEVEASLYRDKKSIWPPFPLWFRLYSFEYVKHVQDKVDTLISFHFVEEIFQSNNPQDMAKKHFLRYMHRWEYTRTKS